MENSFAQKHPELVSQWSNRNYPITPDSIPYGSKKLYWWHGPCGHEWEASTKSRSAGEKCPICSGARVIEGINDLATLRPELVKEWAISNTINPFTVSVGSKKKVRWVCHLGHTWEATIKSRTQGSGCPYCSHNRVLPGYNDLASQKPKLAMEWSPKNSLHPTEVTAFSNRKVWWRCNQGHEWFTHISTRSYGSECPYCSGVQLLPGFNDLQTQHPVLASEWSEKNGYLQPNEVNEKCTKNVWWKCRVCSHEWKSVVKARVKGLSCPVCANRAVKTGYNDLTTTDSELMIYWDYQNNTVDPERVSRRSHEPVWWKCRYGHQYKATIWEQALRKVNCPECAKEFHRSFPQILCSYYGHKHGFQVQLNNSDLLGYPVDIYVPSYSLAIVINAIQTERFEKVADVLSFLCETRGIHLVSVEYSTRKSLPEIATTIISCFHQQNAYFPIDIKQDIVECINLFYKMKQANQSDQ